MDKVLKRISSMRSCARRDGKFVPAVKDILSIWPTDMNCPRCGINMVFSSKESWHQCVTLQHLKESGHQTGIAICCMACNAAWRNLGDHQDGVNTPDTLRKCKLCNSLKPVELFILQKNNSGNLTRSSYCDICRKNYSRSYSSEYRIENKEQRNESKRNQYSANREKELARKREYYLENKDKIIAKARERALKRKQSST